MAFNHSEIEKKWQAAWESNQCFRAENPGSKSNKPKYYALDMFPYPSGAGLHVGHLASYTPTDILSRYKRARGFNVLHPMGYDAFGLPAEQYAIQTGIHPAITTRKAIENFKGTLKSFGYSFDWSRELSTCEPNYYHWTQFLFLKLWEKGLAYQKEAPVNWCPALKTVLANEEVVDGKSERGGHPVIRMPMKQWMLKITDYAERLLQDLDLVDWPERTKEGQRNWIGKSEGAEVSFQVAASSPGAGFDKDGGPYEFQVFTTRPDTLFGVSFLVLAPEHPLVEKITSPAQTEAVRKYREASGRKLEVDRKAATEKSGLFTGAYAIHPLTQKQIPIWVADYVLMDYGTGAIMAVPGHDERDFEFAKKYDLPILRVLDGGELPFMGEGQLVNSEFLNGHSKASAIALAIQEIEKRKLGKKVVLYKLRDWLFSRQRYWGEPFPLIYTKEGGIIPVPLEQLPVVLPEVANYEPSEKGEAPLARVDEWVNTPLGRRETDTMPGSAASSWYFLRFTDPLNQKEAFSHEAQKYWMPVDIYVGGPEHTVGHLLYARFWHKVFFDCGLVSHPEPFKKLFHQGMVLGPDGEKMSKSRGNTISPEEVRVEFGADAIRLYISFMGPVDKDKPWATSGIEGVRRFLDRVWRLTFNEQGQVIAQDMDISDREEFNRLFHKTVGKVTADIENLSLNTAISAMMILVNEMYKLDIRPLHVLKTLAQLLMPMAPHFAEEVWSKLGGEGFVSLAPWPSFDPELAKDDVISMGVQVNGKHRGEIRISLDADEATAVGLATEVASVQAALSGKKIDKVIYKAGRILNLIIK